MTQQFYHIPNKSGTAKFDVETAMIDAEIRSIAQEENLDYNSALHAFNERYEEFTPDDKDLKTFIAENPVI